EVHPRAMYSVEITVEKDRVTGETKVLSSTTLLPKNHCLQGVKVYEDEMKDGPLPWLGWIIGTNYSGLAANSDHTLSPRSIPSAMLLAPNQENSSVLRNSQHGFVQNKSCHTK
ncbi:unnamed protein product, partial [Caretta caretta]